MSIQRQIETKLSDAFQPAYLEVVNESHQHNVPPGSESHFKVVLVSDFFADKRQVQRHQAVYRQLSEEMEGIVHALALHTYTPSEWRQTGSAPASPQCMGGSGKAGA